MFVFSADRCASCPKQLLTIPTVARETMQWKILGAKVPYVDFNQSGTRFQWVYEKPPPTLCPPFLCSSLCYVHPPPPLPPPWGTRVLLNLVRKKGGRREKCNKKAKTSREQENEVKERSSDFTPTPPPPPLHDSVYIYRCSCLTENANQGQETRDGAIICTFSSYLMEFSSSDSKENAVFRR